MREVNRITKEELIKNMKVFSSVYDVVRLVEPESMSVVIFSENGYRLEEKDPCFSVWEKDRRCDNCISLRACTENRRITKFEVKHNDTFSVVAMPYIVVDGDKEFKLSMELVNHVENKNALSETSKKKAVLIVDDIEMNRMMMKTQLKAHYQIYEAQNGIEALEVLNNHLVDLIITDIFMEKMNGYELMRRVKAIPAFRDIPIIAVTENNESSQKCAIEAGADIYIDRPLGPYLSGIAAKMTGRDHGRKELFNMDFLLDTIPGAVIVYKIREHGEMEIVSCSRGVNQLSGWESDEFCNAS